MSEAVNGDAGGTVAEEAAVARTEAPVASAPVDAVAEIISTPVQKAPPAALSVKVAADASPPQPRRPPPRPPPSRQSRAASRPAPAAPRPPGRIPTSRTTGASPPPLSQAARAGDGPAAPGGPPAPGGHSAPGAGRALSPGGGRALSPGREGQWNFYKSDAAKPRAAVSAPVNPPPPGPARRVGAQGAAHRPFPARALRVPPVSARVMWHPTYAHHPPSLPGVDTAHSDWTRRCTRPRPPCHLMPCRTASVSVAHATNTLDAGAGHPHRHTPCPPTP
ncbi:MAG: hypothetical protein WDW38_002696 [Sanguina aurantia]